MSQNTHKYDCDKLLACAWLSDKQKKAVKALSEQGTMIKASKALGISKRALQELMSRTNKKLLAKELDKDVPINQTLRGTSTLYKTDEETGERVEVLQWVKTSKDKEAELEALITVTEALAKKVKGKAIPIPAPAMVSKDLLTTYVNTDLHLGQYSWGSETGNDVNLDTIYKNTINAMKLLVATSPQSEEAIVLDLGDTMHASGNDARTKSGHELDTDSRHAKVYDTLINLKLEMIDIALAKHKKVKYIIVAGNHSDMVPNYLVPMLAAYYKNEPRFEIDRTHTLHKYHRHGETLLGFHHGHATKMQRLPEVMVWDRKEDISSTTYRYWLTGHWHKDSVMDSPISRCESFRNNTPNDAWAQGAGFRGLKQAVSITYHANYGEIARNVCPIKLGNEG